MADQLGTLGAALIAFLGGLLLGRRQIADQAKVEHDQWLRTLRQGAYVQLLSIWETAVRTTEEVTSRDYSDAEDEGNTWEEDILPSVHQTVTEAWEPVWRAVEQVELCGPPSVTEAADHLCAPGEKISDTVLDFTGRWPNERVTPALEQGRAARRLTLTAASEALRTVPRTGEEDRRPERPTARGG